MVSLKIRTKDSFLGVSTGPRRYDLPLDKDEGNLFLRILMGLMCFLAILSFAAVFTLNEMTRHWTAGLTDKSTIEIAAQTKDGNEIARSEMESISTAVQDFLSGYEGIKSIHPMSMEEINALVEPWLGNQADLQIIPLPILISLEFSSNQTLDKERLKADLEALSPLVRLDTHDSWVNDVKRFTNALTFATILLTIIVIFTTIIAISGAIQARMMVYQEELELLHLMGAADRYIVGQIERHIFWLCLQGASIGALTGGFTLTLIGLMAGRLDINLVPDFSLNGVQIAVLCLLPVFAALLAMGTARVTALRHLGKLA